VAIAAIAAIAAATSTTRMSFARYHRLSTFVRLPSIIEIRSSIIVRKMYRDAVDLVE
jgi:hypothetical protein